MSASPSSAPCIKESSGPDRAWQRVLSLRTRGEEAAAERAAQALLEVWPSHADAALWVAAKASARRAFDIAARTLAAAAPSDGSQPEIAVQLALALAALGQFHEAAATLRATLAHDACSPTAWLILSTVLDRVGDADGALRAAHQAVTLAQTARQWVDKASTPAWLLPLVVSAIQRVRQGRAELFRGAFAELRAVHGPEALRRLDRSLDAYLQPQRLQPDDERQRPRFFWFMGLPDAPFHDPFLQPWATLLRDAWPHVRSEAQAVLDQREDALQDFIRTATPHEQKRHLGGDAESPRWKAFFFYRHGRRFDDHHRECPFTSALLESIDLCRVAHQAPEICFSVLAPHSHIKAHHGVTNARLVMHLPLIVPPDCALNLVDRGTHAWQEGRPMMFDDTYLHEAWNRSDRPRVILLMDCWNPHLTPVERLAWRQLVEMIGTLNPAAAAARDHA